MRESTKTALAVLVLLVVAGAFWLILIGPKRDKANELSETTTRLSAEVTSAQQEEAQAVIAKQKFPTYYRQLVLLGKAVPAEAATPSFLVQLNGLSTLSHTSFTSISLGGASEAAEESVETTEDPQSLLPIGAAIGTAGLPAMPYALEFKGGFFQVADFIERLDSLVETKNGEVDAKGRLVTIDSFTLTPPGPEEGGGPSKSSALGAEFQVTTYVTPPDQGLTAGATPAGPGEATETEATP